MIAIPDLSTPSSLPAAHIPRRALLAGAAAGVLAGCANTQTTSNQTPFNQTASSQATSTPWPGTPAQERAHLPHTWQSDWQDRASGHTWRIWLQAPSGPAPTAGHPVLYVLDGNAAFYIAAQLARNNAARPPDLRPDGAIIVGIGHPSDAVYSPPLRQRDYTPPAPGQAATPEAGGAEQLLDFMAQSLQPAIARQWPIDSQRLTLYGHSFGGLLALHALLTRPQQFTRYAAASPSVWWNQGQILETAETFIRRYSAQPRPWRAQLQLHWGDQETAATATNAARAAIQKERRLIERTAHLAAQLQSLQWPQLQVSTQALAGLDHGQVMAPALIDALALAQQARRPAP